MKLMKLFRGLFYDEPYQIDRNMYGLSDGEMWWRDRNSLLESHGYRLRKRLRPDWIPSWTLNRELRPVDCEDSMSRLFSQITDATCISDSSHVIIKKVKREVTESAISLHLSSLRDPKNHCVPIIDSFVDHTIDMITCYFNESNRSTKKVVDFVQQTLEGIAFIHANNVAHRDCADPNIMLDGTSMYLEGFHPVLQSKSRSWKEPAKFRSRSNSRGAKYYFIDFGLSTRFEGTKEGRLVTGRICQDHVPELLDWIPYDPFAIDIYLLEDVYRRNFLEKYSNVQFLRFLVESMTRKDPSQRPKADEALRQLEKLVSQRSEFSLGWRLLKPDVGQISRHWITAECSGRAVVIMVRRRN
ncbi:hypothetical protein A7U60_g350 [Sanghuangporus baumii]|uniref:Protein kinase domain-containing protein n=1 Tax=Sanghuangporus baumii TaxID=108892 RepID=A0A9Q5I5K6_SANBA|nr:hypothetical protein A7U60_g350 [Sanghuangporus baumii]